MKANIFLKENGLKKCSRIVEDLIEQGIDSEFVKDLKCLVESHELVEICGGLQSVGEKLTHGLYESRAVIERLKQAIVDVESCNENTN